MSDLNSARRGPARSLSLDALLQAALALIDDAGPSALSLRRLGASAGVTANALYTYFPTKRDLEQAVADELLRRSAVDAPNEPGRAGVLAIAVALRERLLMHSGAFPFVLASPWTGDGAAELGERVLAGLVDAGLTAADASRTSYALIAYALGTIALDLAEQEPGLRPLDDADRTADRRNAVLASDDLSPLAASTVDVVAQYNSRTQYVWGIERILDGVLVD